MRRAKGVQMNFDFWSAVVGGVVTALGIFGVSLLTEAGKENWKVHQQKAEELYQRALSLKDPVPVIHRGLGMLYESLRRNDEAIAEYQKYLDLAPNAVDRERILRRIEGLKRT